MGIAFSLLGAPLKLVGRVLVGLWAWLCEDLRHVVIAALCAALIWSGLGWRGAADKCAAQSRRADAQAARADRAEALAKSWKDALELFRRDVADAQKRAADADKRNVERVASEFEQINRRTADDYQDRLDDTRAALERVRSQFAAAAAGDRRDGGAAAVPEALTTRCRALGAADCDALLAALPDLLAAAEGNTAKLIALQDYVTALLAVDYDGEVAP